MERTQSMILSTSQIKEWLLDTHEEDPKKRLIISPILDLDKQAKLGDAALDVRLGQTFVIPKRARIEKLDHLADDHMKKLDLYKERHHIRIGDYFVLHPHQFVLGATIEWIHLPPGLSAYVIGRSSLGRDGLVIATATGIHPHFSGVLTLEITNLGEIPIFLYPGLRIAQLFFHTVEGVIEKVNQNMSTFTGATGPYSADAAGSDKEIIKKISIAQGLPRWQKETKKTGDR